MPRSYFTPVLQGQVQTAYNHQFGTAYPGQLWSVTDNTLVDHAAVQLPDLTQPGQNTPANQLLQSRGLQPGRAVSLDYMTDNPRTGIDPHVVMPFDPATVDPEGMWGVLVRNEQMSSNSEGDACWFDKETANVIRAVHWGRIWVMLEEDAAVEKGDPVFIQPDGTFNNVGGTQWPGAKFIADAKDGIAAIQFKGIGA
jgi:hypothetical protein